MRAVRVCENEGAESVPIAWRDIIKDVIGAIGVPRKRWEQGG